VPVARRGAIRRWVGRGLASVNEGPQTPGMDRLQGRSGVSLLPRWEPPGHAEASPRCCGTGSAGSGYRCRLPWLTRTTATKPEIIFQTRSGSYNDDSLIEFLQALYAELDGAKVTLIWDGLPSHRSRSMQHTSAPSGAGRSSNGSPGGYAPVLNPSRVCGETSRAPS
jgi:hypothetical protein